MKPLRLEVCKELKNCNPDAQKNHPRMLVDLSFYKKGVAIYTDSWALEKPHSVVARPAKIFICLIRTSYISNSSRLYVKFS